MSVLFGRPGLSGIFRLMNIIYYSLTSLFKSAQPCAMLPGLWEWHDMGLFSRMGPKNQCCGKGERGKWSSGDSMAKDPKTGQFKKEKVKKIDAEGKQFLQVL